MKHVSRVLFGFSIVAVLALFTACPQAADTKKDAPNPNPLGLDQKAAATLISDLSSISSNFEIDTTSGAITIKKEAAGTITLPKQLSTNPALTLKDAKVTKGTSVTAAKASGDAGFTLTVTKPTANKAEMVTIQLTVAGKDKSGKIVDSVFTIVVTNKKDIDEVTPPPAVTPQSLEELVNTKKAELTAAITTAITTAGDADANNVKAASFTIVPPTEGFDEVSFEWSTDKAANLSFAGNVATVTRPENSGENAVCKILVKLTKSGVSMSTPVEVTSITVLKKEAAPPAVTPQSLEELVNTKKAELTAAITTAITTAGDADKENVKASSFTIMPPADGFDGVTFEWSTDKAANLSFADNVATVTRPESSGENAVCKILVKLTKESVTMTAPVEVTTITVLKKD